MADRTASLDAALAESQASLESLEKDATEFFAAKAAASPESAPLNPVAAAVERAVTTKESVKVTPPAKAPDAKGSGKVSGAPSLKKAAEKVEAPTAVTEVKADPAKDFSDVPRDYKPGETGTHHWKRLTAKSDHFEQLSNERQKAFEAALAEVKALQAAQAAAQPNDELQARLTALTQERDGYLTQLRAVAGERIFDTESKPRRDAALAQAKQVAGPEHASRVESLLLMGESSVRDNAIEELIATLPPLRAAKLTQAVADLDRLTAERAAAAAQGGELWQRRMAESTAAQERARSEQSARALATFDAEVKDWESVGVTADEVALARSVYTGKDATLEDASRAALWGAVGPRIGALLQAEQARVAELEGELAKLRGAQPGVGAAPSGGEVASGEDDDPASTGYSQRIINEAMRRNVRVGVGVG